MNRAKAVPQTFPSTLATCEYILSILPKLISLLNNEIIVECLRWKNIRPLSNTTQSHIFKEGGSLVADNRGTKEKKSTFLYLEYF